MSLAKMTTPMIQFPQSMAIKSQTNQRLVSEDQTTTQVCFLKNIYLLR